MANVAGDLPLPGLPYATPVASDRPPARVGFLIALIGLALIVLGGCFLIGVLLLVTGSLLYGPGLGFGTSPKPLGAAGITLMIVLYAAAFACFGAAAVLLIVGLRRLFASARI